MTGTVIFLDTSIQIALLLHSRSVRERILARMEQYDWKVTGIVVLLEFKRRLFDDARYLLDIIDEEQSLAEVLRRVNRLSMGWQRRKTICIDMIANTFANESHESQLDRLRLYLESLIVSVHGVKTPENKAFSVSLPDFDATFSPFFRIKCAKTA